MKLVQWGMVAGGVAVAAVVVGFGVFSPGTRARAQTPPSDPNAPHGRAHHFQELLAQKLGISVETLQADEKSAYNQMIDDALAAGKITQTQATNLRNSAENGARARGMQRLANGAKRAVTSFVDAAAKTIGISSSDLKSDLQQGKTLAQIAAEHNVSADRLKSGIAAEIKSQLQTAVSKGQITQPQMDRILTNLNSRIDQLIQHQPGKHQRLMRNR